MRSGRDSNIAMPGSSLTVVNMDHAAVRAVAAEMLRLGMVTGGAIVTTSAESTTHDPLDRYLEAQVDQLRDAALTSDPAEALRRFQGLLDTLPSTASGTIRFRVKANIGLRYLALADAQNASRWLIEAFDEAPTDPRAIANKAFGLWIGGHARQAYDYGLAQLRDDPTNEALASYLPQIAVMLPEISDGLTGIPIDLLSRETLVVSGVVFLRGRDVAPEWWVKAREGLATYPDSEHLKLLAAFAEVDEVTRDEEVARTQALTAAQADRVRASGAVLDAYWRSKVPGLANRYDDGAHALAAAMVARQLLQEPAEALDRAIRIADERLTEPQILANAVQVALASGRHDLAHRLIALAPDDPDLAFHEAIVALQENRWDLAVERLAAANLPASERSVAETVRALAKVKNGESDAPSLDAIREARRDSPRSLVLISRVAAERGEHAVAERAYREAVEGVEPDSHVSTRLMVASLAEEVGAPADVIGLLDGHLPADGHQREHAWLAVAHANERPHRRRNLDFFNRLPAAVRSRHEIARAHASVLLDLGQVADALTLLRRLNVEEEEDAYVAVRFVEALRRAGDERGARRFLKTVPLDRLRGDPAFVMALVQAVAANGEWPRAYHAAYGLVRRHQDRHDVALAYVGLGLSRKGTNSSFRQAVAGPDACVTMSGPAGAERTFVIDEGGDFFGIQVESPSGRAAALVAGKRRGDTFEIPKMGTDPETWLLKEIHSKYLRLHHRIMEEFELRYPGEPGLARFTVGEDDVSAVLDLVRRSAETNRERAQLYLDGKAPLAAVARMLGGEPVGFAQYIRSIGGEIATCAGLNAEREAAVAVAVDARGRGAVFDAYTVWTAAEMDLLPVLRGWFGTLYVTHDALDMIDRLIEREREGIGHQQMSVAWVDGQFIRQEVDDVFRNSQIALLEAGRAKIVAESEIRPVLLPDELSEATVAVLEKTGSHFLDAAFLAKELELPLLSEDMHYRAWSTVTAGCSGLWIQAALMAAVERGDMASADYVKAVASLAERRHGHLTLNAAVLHEICLMDGEDLAYFKAALRNLGGKAADMSTHFVAVRDLLANVWSLGSTLAPLRRRAASGLAIEALLRDRPDDWQFWLLQLIRHAPRNAVTRNYLRDWLRGHFIRITDLVGSQAPDVRLSGGIG